MVLYSSISYKLSPPVCHAPLIRRDRFIQLIESCSHHKLILVAAPAGFGKTIFLSQWHKYRSDKGLGATWLTLDRSDKDRFHFIASLLGALRAIRADAGIYTKQLLEAQTTPDLDDVLNNLCGDFHDLQSSMVFFIDDYDWADALGTNRIIETLINRTSPDIQFVIACRKQPKLPIARLLVHNESQLISMDDLRFNTAEASRFLNEIHQLRIPHEQIEFLMDKTEGWVAGLQLVMLAIRDRKSAVDIIEALTGEFRDIADYLASEVLKQQPEILQEFLIKTSVLTRINAELCELLTGRSDSQDVLEQLEAANLFLSPMDESRHWYRYHQMFREFLFSQLRRRPDIDECPLYSLASDWFEKNGMSDDAVQCALLAGDDERAATIVETSAENMIQHGHVRQVIGWFNRIPPQLAESRIRLCMIQIWALFHIGRITQGRTMLNRAKKMGVAGGLRDDPNYSRAKFEEECRTLEACLASGGEDEKTLRRLNRNAMPFSQDYPFFSGTRANALAAGSFSLGNFEVALKFAAWGKKLQANTESSYGVVFALCMQGLVALARGQIGNASYHIGWAEEYALADTGTNSYCCALARCLKGVVHYLRFELDEARGLLTQNLPLVTGCGYVEIWRLAGIIRARILAAEQSWTQAEDILRREIREQQPEWLPRSLPLVDDERVRILIQAGDLESAQSLALQSGISLADPLSRPRRWQREKCLPLRTQARLFLARNQPEQSLQCIRIVKNLARRSGRHLRVLELTVLEALALDAAGKQAQAEESIVEAIRMATAERIVAPFVEEGPESAKLLQTLARRPEASATIDFTIDVLTAFDRVGIGLNKPPTQPGRGVRLTQREQDVLRLLAAGAENREISDQLSISDNTVKWHVRNILEKFAVSNRLKAVLMAREKGFV